MFNFLRHLGANGVILACSSRNCVAPRHCFKLVFVSAFSCLREMSSLFHLLWTDNVCIMIIIVIISERVLGLG